MCISGAEERMNQNKGVFQQYLDGPKDAQVIETIKTGKQLIQVNS